MTEEIPRHEDRTCRNALEMLKREEEILLVFSFAVSDEMPRHRDRETEG